MEIKIEKNKKSAIVDLNTSQEYVDLYDFYKLKQVIKMNVEYAFILIETNPINAWDVIELGYIYVNILGEVVDYQLPLDFHIEKLNKIKF